ncbi:histidine phosphatase family protein [Micromonospora sp. bgisy143]|uniref:histidine phosphatase family protein n=1 Tax=Micromonospora sp. bgisy143 TaxID=3413790 RepID=UPI003EBAD861
MILLIRHAEAIWTEAAVDEVVRDPDLTDNGRLQASYLAKALQSEPVDVVVSSPLRRAAATFAVVTGHPGNATDFQEWLREIHYPDWRGWRLATVQSILREHDRESVEQRWAGLAGGESARDHIAIVRGGAESFLRRHGLVRSPCDPALWEFTSPQRRIAMIGHVGSLATIVSLLLGLAPVAWERQRFPVPNASITRLAPVQVGSRFAFSLHSIGDDSFMPPEVRRR